LHLLAGPAAAHLEQSVYDGVQVHLLFRHSWVVLLALGWGCGAFEGRASRKAEWAEEGCREELLRCVPAQAG
jgi:hypothetical protein